ncbi:MAG: HEPN domain-containing protein [Minwuia sp.]|uniref:HEPN domain-containing protein n=1 Tax=Minwuia sp. TaxID=2493630 RepID=UPI003A89C76A
MSANALSRACPSLLSANSVLSNLGRVGRASLTKKVLHRSEGVGAAAAEKLPSLDLPCVEAVKMRNHFVHGGEARFDYRHEFETFAFLTDTLEFVFAVSDLIDLGWDCTHWVRERSTLTHPFKRYLFSYQNNLRRLKELLGSVDNDGQP